MKENQEQVKWETRLAEMAAHYPFPPTPDIAPAVARRLAARQPAARQPAARMPLWHIRPVRVAAGVLAAIVLALALILAVPQVRAAVFEFLRIGAIGIVVEETPAAIRTTPASPLPQLAGATTLAQARDQVDFPIRLPAYPAGLGPPGQVYLQTPADAGPGAQVLILVWDDPERPAEARLSLSIIDVPFYGLKQAPAEIILETRVNGQYAYWIQGPHHLQLQNGEYTEWVFVAGNVLLWTDGELTYRLESGLSLEEAKRIAESLPD